MRLYNPNEHLCTMVENIASVHSISINTMDDYQESPSYNTQWTRDKLYITTYIVA